MEGTRLRPLAAVAPLDIALKARARVAKLEHQALGKAPEVDRVRVRHEVESGIQQLLCGNGNGHPRVHQALGVHHRTCDCKDLNTIAVLVEGLLQVQDQHQDQGVVCSTCNDRVPQDGVRLVLRVRLICYNKASVLSQLHNGVQRLHPDRDHVSINIDAPMVPQELQAKDVCFALPHLLLHIDPFVEHRQLRHSLIAPNLILPVRVRLQVVGTKSVQPKAGRLFGPYPDLMDDLRDLCRTNGSHVLLAAFLPFLAVLHLAFAPVPMIELADGSYIQLWKLPEHGLEVLILRPQAAQHIASAVDATHD
mmetsp:Transcript_18700/g.44360  ORF Transcript_18700/g.44360 Transcript_18700/m.44360 type:complete len:307 (+) Transcript_18700:1155-2075(+)